MFLSNFFSVFSLPFILADLSLFLPPSSFSPLFLLFLSLCLSLFPMVSPSPLSNGNSLSSCSRDFFVEYGITPPSSAHGQEDPLVMISSSQERRMDIDSGDSIPSVGDASTEGSFASEDNPVGLGNANASEVFRAAQQLTHKDRLEAVEERRKNQDLVNFILTKGHSLQEVQSFLSGNGIQRSLNDQDL